MNVIELAPNGKRNLTLKHPLILVGFSIPDANIGALVTLPMTLHPRSGAPLPRVVEIPGGVLMRTGAANPGIEKLVREHRRAWAASAFPIIVAFASQAVRDWATMAKRIENVENVGGVELHFNPTIDVVDAIRIVRAATELPILAKLDLDHATQVAADGMAAGADALVIARAPRGMAIVQGKPWYGRLYSPTTKPLVLRVFQEIRELRLEIPVVACGGIHSAEDTRAFLAAGACAVELDSATWVDPACVAQIAAELEKPE
jgi:dihydroorotate dehydrogenase (NAD+) catalytic subunit